MSPIYERTQQAWPAPTESPDWASISTNSTPISADLKESDATSMSALRDWGSRRVVWTDASWNQEHGAGTRMGGAHHGWATGPRRQQLLRRLAPRHGELTRLRIAHSSSDESRLFRMILEGEALRRNHAENSLEGLVHRG